MKNARVAKKRSRSSRVELSEACQEQLLDAVTRECEGIIQVEKAKQAAQTVPQQPKPLPLKRPHASFLEDYINSFIPAPKRYRPESVDSFVTQWVESGPGPDLYRERHCRSDTLLSNSNRELIPRRLTKSAPNMEELTRDPDGFVVPPTPPLSHSLKGNEEVTTRLDSQVNSQVSWYGPTAAPSDMSGASTGSSRKSLVEDPYYRDNNLAENHIYMRDFYEEFPEEIAGLVDNIRKDRDSPGLSLDEVRQNTRLYDLEMGTAEPAVENYFKANIFPDPGRGDSLKRIDKNPILRQAVPNSGVGSKLKVSTPVPDMLYGYNRLGAFPEYEQQAQIRSMGNDMAANTQGLMYPFFVIEFKADGPGGSGSMWVATNQCLGASASCVNIAERLNRLLNQCKSDEVRPIDSAAFSIAMNGTEARLYISWKHNELDYYMRRVKSFALQEPEHYVEFRKHVLNIIDWGKDKRLTQIRKSLNDLLEESKRKMSAAKSRPPPSDDSGGGGSRSSRSRRAGSGGEGGAGELGGSLLNS